MFQPASFRIRPGPLAAGFAALLLAAWAPVASAQGIYTCVDGKGRRLTSDRPILECIDREQMELNNTGTVKRRIGPSMTADEQAAEDERLRKIAEAQAKVNEERRRDRSLINRYKTRAAHDKERGVTLAQVDDVIVAGKATMAELVEKRRVLEAQAEFYAKNPEKMPPRLKRQFDEIDEQIVAQKRYMDDQGAEKQRVNARFDAELARLERLWGGARPGETGTPSIPTKTQAPAPPIKQTVAKQP